MSTPIDVAPAARQSMFGKARARIRTPFASASRWWNGQGQVIRIACFVAVLGIAIFLPLLLPRYWQSVLFFPVGMFVLLALGLNIVVGMAGLLDLGYVAFYAVGAYTTAMLTTVAHLNPWAALPCAIALAMFAGVVLGVPTLRLRGDYLAIVTLGFGEIVRIIAINTESLGQSRGIVGIPHPPSLGNVGFAQLPLPYYFLTLTAIVAAILMTMRLGESRVGRSWIALREDEDAAEAMGVHTFTMKLWAFAIGASTGGLAGWLYTSKVGFISPDNFPFFLSITILAAVVLGGMGSIPGVIAGAIAVAFLPEYLRDAAAGEQIAAALHWLIGGVPGNITQYRILLFGAALVVMMIFRPQGLIPSRRRAAELAEAGPTSALGGELQPSNATEARTEAIREQAQAPAQPPASGSPEAQSASSIPEPSDSGQATLPEALRRPPYEGNALEISQLSMRFGGVEALRDVTMEVPAGQIFGVIGPNGAGKTTLFNCITGVFRPTGGDIRLAGQSIVGLPPHRITESGMARTFQNIRLFPNMTALENVLVGADARHRTSVPGALFGSPRHRREERTGRMEAEALLSFVGIGRSRDRLATHLSYGDQRRLEIARAMATGPRVLLLDEPAAGMNASEKDALVELIRKLRDSGLTVVIIEHDMALVMHVCDRLAVLDFGEKIAEGSPQQVQQDDRVIRAYLGVPDDAA